ncbi:hypothetical protein Tco_1104082 [Tanacetum coccineum]
MIDYALWEVIENGNTAPKTTVVEGVEKVMPPTTAKEKAQKRLEVKARNTLMMGIPNEHQLKFNSIKDAKLLMKAVEKRFGGNAAIKKTQRNLLKKQYENFIAPSSEMLDQTFDRLQKLVSQNKTDLDTISMDDLYINLKVYKPEVKGMSSSSSSTQNMAFVSSSNNNNSNTNGAVSTAQAVNTANGVFAANTQVNASNIDNLSDAVICAFLASQPNNPQLAHEDLQQIHPDDLEEMDLRWQMTIDVLSYGRLFRKPACMEYTQWVFCKRCGKPIKHHRAYLTKSGKSMGGVLQSGKKKAIKILLTLASLGGSAFASTHFESLRCQQTMGTTSRTTIRTKEFHRETFQYLLWIEFISREDSPNRDRLIQPLEANGIAAVANGPYGQVNVSFPDHLGSMVESDLFGWLHITFGSQCKHRDIPSLIELGSTQFSHSQLRVSLLEINHFKDGREGIIDACTDNGHGHAFLQLQEITMHTACAGEHPRSLARSGDSEKFP